MKTTNKYQWLGAAMTLLLALLSSTVARAQESKIIVWQNDGNKSEVLFTDMPEFSYLDGNVVLKGTSTELAWPIENVQKMTFEVSEPDPDGIQTVQVGQLDLANGGAVYDLSGKLIKTRVKSLSELPKGTYVVKDGNVTVKVVKK
jgi:hypothetical protein